MNIQSNINQAFSLAGLLISQNPAIKQKVIDKDIGRGLQTEAEAGQRLLSDIAENTIGLATGERKPYSEIELKDIESRIPEANRKIYNAIIAADDPRYSKYIDKKAFGNRETRSQIISSLTDPNVGLRQFNEISKAGGMNKYMTDTINQMKQKAAEAQQSQNMQKQASKNFIKTTLEGVYSPLTDPRKGGI